MCVPSWVKIKKFVAWILRYFSISRYRTLNRCAKETLRFSIYKPRELAPSKRLEWNKIK
jgi:hypothetical protein